MNRRSFIQGLSTGAALAGPAHEGRPEYPLYAPFFGSGHPFSDHDLSALAGAFDFVYGQTPSRHEMERARSFRRELQFIRYIGAWTVRADVAEHGLRRRVVYYCCGTLAGDVAAGESEIAVIPAEGVEEPLLRASTIPGEFSRSPKEYVTWVRIGDELARVESFDAGLHVARVSRNFDPAPGAADVPHRKGDRVFAPAYGVAPQAPNEWESSRNISYHYDSAFSDRWDYLYNALVRFVEEGGDGIWIDILMDRSLRESDVNGQELGSVPAWDFAASRPYTRDQRRAHNEAGVRTIQERFRARFGRYPVIYGNNMMASRYEEGRGGHKFYLLSTPRKPRPVDGMCFEDFMGGYESAEWSAWQKSRAASLPKKACYPCDAGYKNWAANVQMLMNTAQAGMHALPLIINAGMKTAIFEAAPPQARHEWERWAYASYLLGVEKKNGICPTKLGVPMFTRKGDERYVAVDPMYYWRIGEPAETAREVAQYRRRKGHVHARRFRNALVLVNPADGAERVALDAAYTDPESGDRVREIEMAGKSGRVLLR